MKISGWKGWKVRRLKGWKVRGWKIMKIAAAAVAGDGISGRNGHRSALGRAASRPGPDRWAGVSGQ